MRVYDNVCVPQRVCMTMCVSWWSGVGVEMVVVLAQHHTDRIQTDFEPCCLFNGGQPELISAKSVSAQHSACSKLYHNRLMTVSQLNDLLCYELMGSRPVDTLHISVPGNHSFILPLNQFSSAAGRIQMCRRNCQPNQGCMHGPPSCRLMASAT
jgi:hypothetical protein